MTRILNLNLRYIDSVNKVCIHWIEQLATLSRETLILLHANNKGVDQPAHSRTLIRAFVIRSLKSITAYFAIILIIQLAYVAEQS